MKRAKRILSLLLSLCLVLGLFPSTAFAASSNLPFTDVDTTDWYYDAIKYAYEKGMMNGTSTTAFSPNDTTTRGMIVTILHRMEGTPAAAGTAFTDVPAGQWYSDAVSWASANGIVGGYGNGLFGPGDPITREQMAAILSRYSTHKGYAVGAAGSVSGFTDASQVSSYAVEPMGWAIGNGLISGTGNNTLAPKGNATRAQVATILMRFCENVAGKGNDTPETPASKTYTVTFDLNYGSDTRYDVKTVKEGETVSKPSNPSRSGYSFNGWYAEKSGGRQFDFKTGITSDLTLYAHWSSNSSSSGGDFGSSGGGGGGYVPPAPTSYTVTFYMNDGTDTVHTTVTVTAGNSVSAPAQPVRERYSFDGWYADAATTEAYSFSGAVTGKLDLYAKWEPISATDYYTNNADLLEIIKADESNDVLNETEAKSLLEGKGFVDNPISYDYSIAGNRVDDTEVANGSTDVHPMYQTLYMSQVGEAWAIYVINGSVFANPVSFNLESDLEAELLFSESETFTSYDDATNQFYVTIPHASEAILHTVDEINAETLDGLTIEVICTLSGATVPEATDEYASYNEQIATMSFDESYALDTMSARVSYSSEDPLIVVSLGDSYSSGESIEKFYGQDKALDDKVKDDNWLAHRSQRGWPALLKVPGVSGTMADYMVPLGSSSSASYRWYFAAASGATTWNFQHEFCKEYRRSRDGLFAGHVEGFKNLPPQLDAFNNIRGDVDYVTLSIGGNDVGFADIVTTCAVNCAYLHFGSTAKLEDQLNDTWAAFSTTRANIKKAYEDIRDAAGSQAAIIVAGYPQLLEPNGKGLVINKREAQLVDSNVSRFNDEIEGIVNECRRSGMNIYFVDVEPAFSGHEAYSNSPWINKIILSKQEQDLSDKGVGSAYSVHPNARGAQAYARLVNAKIEEIENSKSGHRSSITGVITIADTDTDMTNNLPLEGAQIILTKLNTIPALGVTIPSIASTESGSDGRYTINDLAPGTYGIIITKEGYISISGTVTIADNVENYYNAAIEAISQDYAGDGTASGTVYDALTGQSVPGLTLNIRSGINVTDGTIVATISTGTDGKYTTPHLPAGNYSVEVVDNRTLTDDASRYLSSTFTIKILGNHMIANQDGYVTNGLQADQLRIVLKWGESPRDLDSHLVGPAGDSGRFHVYYSNKNYRANSELMANLDLDDTSSYGPETTTIYEMTPGVYTFMVHDYTNRSRSSSTALSASGAYVEVYMGASTTAAYTFYVPAGDGTLWTVFSYDSNTGTIIPINTMSHQSSPGSVGSNYQVRDAVGLSDEPEYDLEPVEDPLKDYEIAELQNSAEDNTPQGNQPEPVDADNSEVEDSPSIGQQEPGTGDTEDVGNTSQESTNDSLSETGNVPEVPDVDIPTNEATIETDAQT